MKNNSYTINGNLVSAEAEPTQRGSISVRKFVLKSIEDYPQLFEFELVNKSVPLIDGVAPGQEVNVSFSIRGREYNGRVFHNLSAFRVEALKGGAAAASSKTASATGAIAGKTTAPTRPASPAKAAPVADTEEPVF